MHIYEHIDEISQRRKLVQIINLGDQGQFELELELEEVKQLFLVVGNIEGIWYAHPHSNYVLLSFPTPSSTEFQRLDKALVSLSFQRLNENDCNVLIPAFNKELDQFINDHFYDFALDRYKGSDAIKTKLGVSKKSVSNDSTQAKDATSFYNWVGAFSDSIHFKFGKFYSVKYFETYARYSLAELELMAGKSRKELYEDYLMSQPIQYFHPIYTKFFTAFYDQVIGLVSPRYNAELLKSINADRNPQSLLELFKKDSLVLSDRVGELAIVVGLRDAMTDRRFSKSTIKETLLNCSKRWNDGPIALVAENILYQLKRGKAGEKLEAFEGMTFKLDKWESVSELNGYTYLFFFADWCTSCKKELQLLSRLQEAYGADIQFVVIGLDDDISAMKTYMQSNKNLKFEFVYTGNTPEIREVFNLKAIPQAVMLNPDGALMYEYTRKPSEGIQSEFDKIVQLLHPKNTGKTWQSK